jgi:two-component system, sensor histidine kinase RpfC
MIEDADESIEGMDSSVQSDDAAQFRFAAHAMKSCSNNIGAKPLAALCARLENITETDFHARGSQHFQAVNTALAQVRTELSMPTVTGPLQPAASSG